MWSFFSRDPAKDFHYDIGEKIPGLENKSIWSLHHGKKKVILYIGVWVSPLNFRTFPFYIWRMQKIPSSVRLSLYPFKEFYFYFKGYPYSKANYSILYVESIILPWQGNAQVTPKACSTEWVLTSFRQNSL